MTSEELLDPEPNPYATKVQEIKALVSRHAEHHLNRARKLGLNVSDCSCELCRIYAIITGAKQPGTGMKHQSEHEDWCHYSACSEPDHCICE